MHSILMVDDSELVRLAMEAILEDGGFRVVGVGSLAEARAHTAERFDAVVLDFNLPDGYGTELIVELRALHPTTALVLLTGEHDATTVADVDLVLVKGGDPEQLVGGLEQAIATRLLQQAAIVPDRASSRSS